MPPETHQEILDKAKSVGDLIKWFGGGILAGLFAGICVAVADHYALRELTAKVEKIDTQIAPRVERMWYEGGWEGTSIAQRKHGPITTQPSSQP